MNIHEIRAGEIGVPHEAREKEYGSEAKESSEIDPVQGLKPVQIFYAMLASVRAHRPEGVNADGR
jgi:hypothetical protein